MTDRVFRRRFAFGTAVLLLAMGLLGWRLAYLHLGEHGDVRRQAELAHQVTRTIAAGRGNIYDCNGQANMLALTLAVKDVCADPGAVAASNGLAQVASVLGRQFDIPVDELAVRLNRPDRHFAYVQRFVLEDEAEQVRRHGLPGVFFRDTIVRHYPLGAFMCHVLGFVNYDGQGCAGVEQRADRYLRGCPGLGESLRDAHGRELYWEQGRNIPALKGANVYLTLDQNLQFIAEQALDRAMAEHSARAAWAVVERVRTGEILAMASRPAFDLNAFSEADENVRLNRAAASVYEPGSTFKAIVFAAALNEGMATPDTVYDCEDGAWFHAGRILRDFHSYGRLTFADGLQKSSNIMAAKLAVGLGDRRFHRYLRAFGVGEKTGLDLPGEERGILHPVNAWSAISGSRIAIGQGVAVTGLQMLNVYCALANDGFLMRPYVIREIRAQDGALLFRQEPRQVRTCVSYETAVTMRRLLERVTEEGGTGRRAQIEGYRVAGKTGTAQKPAPGGYSETDYMASFVGFLPAEAPEVGVIVVVDTPQPLHTGGRVAGPAFNEIAEQAVRYLDIPPSRTPRLAQAR